MIKDPTSTKDKVVSAVKIHRSRGTPIDMNTPVLYFRGRVRGTEPNTETEAVGVKVISVDLKGERAVIDFELSKSFDSEDKESGPMIVPASDLAD